MDEVTLRRNKLDMHEFGFDDFSLLNLQRLLPVVIQPSSDHPLHPAYCALRIRSRHPILTCIHRLRGIGFSSIIGRFAVGVFLDRVLGVP
jgi:hypothetical protein